MYKNPDRVNRLRICAGWSLPLLALMLLMGISCGVPKPSDEDWQDSTKSLWITVTSIPPDAEVYGVSDGVPGTLLGRTPLTLKFWKSWGTEGSVMWQCPNQDASINEVFIHSSGKAMFQTTDMPGDRSKSHTTATILGLDRNKAIARFHCYVVKEGYKPNLLKDTFKAETGHTDIPHVVKGRKRYNAELVPLEQHEPSATE